MCQVPLAEVQAALVRVFHKWGQPGCFRVDNGRPFGDPGSDIVPVLALWLIGPGIDVSWKHARQPRDNAKVERMQGVTASWAELARCCNATMLNDYEYLPRMSEAMVQLATIRMMVRRLA